MCITLCSTSKTGPHCEETGVAVSTDYLLLEATALLIKQLRPCFNFRSPVELVVVLHGFLSGILWILSNQHWKVIEMS